MIADSCILFGKMYRVACGRHSNIELFVRTIMQLRYPVVTEDSVLPTEHKIDPCFSLSYAPSGYIYIGIPSELSVSNYVIKQPV